MEALTTIERAGRDRVGPVTHRKVWPEHGGYITVAEHPFELSAVCGLDDDDKIPSRLAMVRGVSAEHRNDGPAYWLAVAEAFRNYEERKGRSFYSLATWDQRKDMWGWFGQQKGGRFCSTAGGADVKRAFDPHRGHAVAVETAMDKRTALAKGADKFFSPSGMGGRDAAVKIVEKWGREGFQWVGHIDGISTRRLMMLKWQGPGGAEWYRAVDFLMGHEAPNEPFASTPSADDDVELSTNVALGALTLGSC